MAYNLKLYVFNLCSAGVEIFYIYYYYIFNIPVLGTQYTPMTPILWHIKIYECIVSIVSLNRSDKTLTLTIQLP